MDDADSKLITWAYKSAVGRDEIFTNGDRSATDTTMATLYTHNVEMISHGEVVPGDLVFITDGSATVTHGGLFQEWVSDTEFRFVNASSYFDAVVIDTWPIQSERRGQTFVAFGRLRIVFRPS